MFFYLFATVAALIVDGVVAENSGCYCGPATDEEIYCRSTWISHVRTKRKTTKPLEIMDHFTLTHINYTVEHIKVYKPLNRTCGLPTTILSVAERHSMCGIDSLMIKENYLLAGTDVLGSKALHINACDQFRVKKMMRGLQEPYLFIPSMLYNDIKCP